MRKDKKQAIKLRKTGLSYLQISQQLGVAKSTLSFWLKDLPLSKKAENKIKARVNQTSIKALIKRNKQQTQIAIERHNKILSDSKKTFADYKKDILFISGVCLYWGEGYKKGASGSSWKAVDLANSDPAIACLFIKFLKKYLQVDKNEIWAQLIIAPNQDIDKAINFWETLTGLKKERFMGTYSKVSVASKGKRHKNSLPNGTIHIRVNNVEKFFILIGWIECLKNNYGV
ncbi:MAG: helix-turn-helix domain-containing protein [bacterium]